MSTLLIGIITIDGETINHTVIENLTTILAPYAMNGYHKCRHAIYRDTESNITAFSCRPNLEECPMGILLVLNDDTPNATKKGEQFTPREGETTPSKHICPTYSVYKIPIMMSKEDAICILNGQKTQNRINLCIFCETEHFSQLDQP